MKSKCTGYVKVSKRNRMTPMKRSDLYRKKKKTGQDTHTHTHTGTHTHTHTERKSQRE